MYSWIACSIDDYVSNWNDSRWISCHIVWDDTFFLSSRCLNIFYLYSHFRHYLIPNHRSHSHSLSLVLWFSVIWLNSIFTVESSYSLYIFDTLFQRYTHTPTNYSPTKLYISTAAHEQAIARNREKKSEKHRKKRTFFIFSMGSYS